MTPLRLSALFLFLLNTAGLLLHSQLIPRGRIRAGMFCFYTNLSNLLLTVYELLLFCAGFAPTGGCGRRSPTCGSPAPWLCASG